MLKYIAQTVEEETKTGIKYMRVDIIVDSAYPVLKEFQE